jgi:hypothetical protein
LLTSTRPFASTASVLFAVCGCGSHASKRKPPQAFAPAFVFGPPYLMLVEATTTCTA